MLRGPIAHAVLDGEVHLDRAGVGVEGEQDEVRVHDLHVGRLGDVASGHGAGTALHELQSDGMPSERPQAELLDVQDDLGDVLLDVLDRAELVEDAGDLDAGDGRALEGAEQDATQRVAERDAVALLERGHLEAAHVAVRLHLVDPRGRSGLRLLWGFEFDHERKIDS